MLKKRKNKKGFSTILALIGGVMSLVFLTIFGLVFINQLNDANLLTANSASANVTDQMIGNVTTGINNVSVQIPTVFTIGAFILIIVVLLVAWTFARRQGLIGGSSLG